MARPGLPTHPGSDFQRIRAPDNRAKHLPEVENAGFLENVSGQSKIFEEITNTTSGCAPCMLEVGEQESVSVTAGRGPDAQRPDGIGRGHPVPIAVEPGSAEIGRAGLRFTNGLSPYRKGGGAPSRFVRCWPPNSHPHPPGGQHHPRSVTQDGEVACPRLVGFATTFPTASCADGERRLASTHEPSRAETQLRDPQELVQGGKADTGPRSGGISGGPGCSSQRHGRTVRFGGSCRR